METERSKIEDEITKQLKKYKKERIEIMKYAPKSEFSPSSLFWLYKRIQNFPIKEKDVFKTMVNLSEQATLKGVYLSDVFLSWAIKQQKDKYYKEN